MNELDVVRVKETVMATPITDELPIAIEADWTGTIVSAITMSKTIHVQPPIIVKELAEQIGISPYRLIYDLASRYLRVECDV